MDGIFCATGMLQIILIVLCCSVYCEGGQDFCTEISSRGVNETCPCDITGHKPESKKSFPYVVSLQWVKGSSSVHICGGTLVTQQKVLTSAQCVIKSHEGVYWAVAGNHHLYVYEGTQQKRRVAEQIVHRNYFKLQGTPHNDVAVFLLYSPFIYTEFVRPAMVPYKPLPEKERLVVAGWGSVREDSAETLPELQFVYRHPIPSDFCGTTVGKTIDNLTICTLSVVEGPCLGDSGAGAVHDGFVYGLISWMHFKCYPHGGYSMLMNVYGYRDFVHTY